jgi:hypothetical protein
MKKIYKIINSCQISGDNKLVKIISLGNLPSVNSAFSIEKSAKPEFFFPAELYYSQKSKMAQLNCIVDKKILFPKSYPYTSSTTKILRDNFKELAEEVFSIFHINNNELIIDIGSNDGNLLSNFKNKMKVLGVTPENIGKLAIKKGIPTMLIYFYKHTVNQIISKYSKAKIITATNVFAHIDNINQLMANIKKCLSEDGIFISESHYLPKLIKDVQYDTIYHEHLRYYSLLSLDFLFKKHGLEIFHAKKINTHGGSIRVYCSYINKYKKNNSVISIFNEERLLLTKKNFLKFSEKVNKSKIDLWSLLSKLKKLKKNIAGISAPSRASTLINFVGLDQSILNCVFEIKGSYKIGRYVPGTNIPILVEKISDLKKYDYLIIFSWHIFDQIKKNLKKLGYHGKLICPLPTTKIYDLKKITKN